MQKFKEKIIEGAQKCEDLGKDFSQIVESPNKNSEQWQLWPVEV